MTEAVIYALAVDRRLSPAPAAAPLDVLSRQLPRLAVHLLNAETDRGLRFFPLIGRHGEQRRFFVVEDLLAVSTLLELHGQQPAPRFVVDGCIRPDVLRVRIHEGETGRARFDQDIPFDPRSPLPAVSRIMFELTGLLGWPGAPPPVPELAGPALVSYLVARDNLLSVEAGLVERSDRRPSANAMQALVLAPGEREVQQLALEIWARRAAGGAPADLPEMLVQACSVVDAEDAPPERVASFLTAAAALLEKCGKTREALARYERVVELWPARSDAACRAATLHFETGRLRDARRVLRRTFDAGQRGRTVLAELAVVEEQLGNGADHERLIEELLRTGELPPPMVRIAVSYLLDRDREAEALALVEDCLRREPEHPGPWFDKGRALVALDRCGEAVEAFETCLRLEPREALRAEAERHLRFARTPQLLQAMRDVDDALLGGDLRVALRRARRLVRGQRRLPEAWLFLGVTLQRMHRMRRAERALRRALALQPGLGEAHNRLGILLVGRGRHREGYEHLQQAAALQPREPSVHIHLAQACRYLGKREEGLQALARAERLGGAAEAVEAVRRLF